MRWSPSEYAKFLDICTQLEIHPTHLGSVMHHESGFDPAKITERSSGTGLIMWMGEKSNTYFGMSREQFQASGVSAQLELIRKRYAGYRDRVTEWDLGSVYGVVALPVCVGHPPDWAIVHKDGTGKPPFASWDRAKFYEANPTWDPEHTGTITPGSLAMCLRINTRGNDADAWYKGLSGGQLWPWPDVWVDAVKHIQGLGYKNVVDFQRNQGLVPDGQLGGRTRSALLREFDRRGLVDQYGCWETLGVGKYQPKRA